MRLRLSKFALAGIAISLCCAAVAGWFFIHWFVEIATPSFDRQTESTEQTLEQFVADNQNAYFVPRGGSSICQRTASTRDGYDVWWRFDISESDFLSLVKAVAEEKHGPAEVKMSNSPSPPSDWQPTANVPEWWGPGLGMNTQSIQWCFDAGPSDRRHGWFFSYNADTKTAWVWHWNHQWSNCKCR